MKKIFLFAAIAALFAACSSKDEVVNDNTTQQPQLEKGAIGFDVYTQKATTRAGWVGSLTTDLLKETYTAPDEVYSKANGFGVFGYYTDNNEYEQRSVPNFMYNQQVTWSGSYWQYEPIMYWPNEYGKSAESDDQDKVSFFAYAPYVKVIPTSGKVANTLTPPLDNTKELESYGITGMTRNSNQGDPILKYIASFDYSKSVDLCWGVQPEMQWNTTQYGNDKQLEVGMPWLNVQRPAEAATQQAANQRIKFVFKHATAQMRVKIDADVDVDGRGHDNEVAKKTRVWVRQVTFKGFAMKGSLNLNNDAPNKEKWLDYNGQNELVAEDITVYDGRKDGKEGVNGAIATNEKVTGLNPRLIQDDVYRDSDGKSLNDANNKVYDVTNAITVGKDPDYRTGVTNTAVNLFKSDVGDFFHVIPVDNETFEVEIVYDIETVDASLAQNLSDGATKGSSIENRITKSIKFGDEECLKAGHSYTLNLHLGLNSVKFDAAVTDWITEPSQDVDLPLNVPSFEAKNPASSSSATFDIPFRGDYTFAITGLDGGESVTYTPDVTIKVDGWTSTPKNANAAGIAIQTIQTTVNPNTTDREHKATWTGNQSSKGVELTFTQKAHPLFMTISKVENVGNNGVITLTRHDTDAHKTTADWSATTGWFCDGSGTEITTNGDPENATTPAHGIAVYRNGIKLEWQSTDIGASDFKKFNFKDVSTGSENHTNTIKIGDKLQPGDVIKVVLKTGDAPVETVSATVGGFVYAPAAKTIIWREATDAYSLAEFKPTYVGHTDPAPDWAGTISQFGDVVSISGSNLKTTAIGTGTLSATLSTTLTGSDMETTPILNITVVKQDSKIKDGFADASSSTSAFAYSSTPKILKNFESLKKAIGSKDTDHELTDDVTFEVVRVIKNGSVYNSTNIRFNDSPSYKTRLSAYEDLIAGDTYEIVVKASHPGDDHYNATEKIATITVNVTAAP